MAVPNYVNYVPRWAQNERRDAEILDDTPNIGIEPPYRRSLSIRIVPRHDEFAISAVTLIDTVLATQKILTYSAHEAAFGVQFEFADLRSVHSDVEELARMRIEPFEQGSFVIPAVLDERKVAVSTPAGSREVSSREILERFVAVIEGVDKSPEFAASIGVVTAVQELGTILRREASALEYYPLGYSPEPEPARSLSITRSYVERVAENLKRRLDMHYQPDTLAGRLIAVDVARATLRLRLSDGSEIRGTFERTAAESVINSLNRNVELHGVVGRRNRQITSIRALICECGDEG
ncbi:MAG: hypothetical protein ACREHD_25370 [Pirellulales bacterium]